MGRKKKENADNADASLRSASFARRICFSSLAIPSERTGGVAVASATANAREAPTHPLSCTSFASIFSCACDNDPRSGEWSTALPCDCNEQPPGSGRARAALRKCDERSSGAKRRICVICVSFFFLPTPKILTPHEITSIRRKIPVSDCHFLRERRRLRRFRRLCPASRTFAVTLATLSC